MANHQWKLVVHGGAGIIERSRIAPEQEREIRAALDHALGEGAAVLVPGGAALDAVEAAVRALEDDPHFNAGRGAVFTYDGAVELDAAVMDGGTRAAGAVAGVTTTRNPVSLARAVMEASPHVFISREGADLFAREHRLEQVENGWFMSEERRRQLESMKADPAGYFDIDLKYGTVGAVALDAHGHVAAATSTGGITGKRWGRIGDSPLIGAGTWADDRSVAVSTTGSGEHFIRAAAAHQLAMRVQLGESLEPALQAVLDDVAALGGRGGMIAVTADGAASWAFSTAGMYRAMADTDGRRVALYSEAE